MFIESEDSHKHATPAGVASYDYRISFYKHSNPLDLQNKHIKWEEELYKYITGVIQNKGQKMPAINGINYHIHFSIYCKPKDTS